MLQRKRQDNAVTSEPQGLGFAGLQEKLVSRALDGVYNPVTRKENKDM